MSGLALKTLLYDWRRFAPAAVAVSFSGLLVLLQAAIILGIFSLSSQYVTRSGADLWIGYPGVQSIDLGRPISGDTEVFAWANAHVRGVEPFVWGSGSWRAPSRGMVNVYIVGISIAPGSMALAGALPPALRARLAEPDAVLVDRADVAKLGVGEGRVAEINGRYVRVVGLTHGLRALGGVNVIASLATARRLDPGAGPDGRVAYLLAQLDDPKRADAVAASLNRTGRTRGFEAIPARRFAQRTTVYWLLESGAGVAFVFGSLVAIFVAVIITSQTHGRRRRLPQGICGAAGAGVLDAVPVTDRGRPERLGRAERPRGGRGPDADAGGRREVRRHARRSLTAHGPRGRRPDLPDRRRLGDAGAPARGRDQPREPAPMMRVIALASLPVLLLLSGCGRSSEVAAAAAPTPIAVARGVVEVQGGLVRVLAPRDGSCWPPPHRRATRSRRGRCSSGSTTARPG